MSISVYSPFTGEQVKVRPQDVGRAVKDRSDHTFYVLERPGGGYYAAPTRAGGQRDIDKYDAMLAKQNQARDAGAMGSSAQIAAASRRATGGKLKLAGLLIILAAAAWAVLFGPLRGWLGGE